MVCRCIIIFFLHKLKLVTISRSPPVASQTSVRDIFTSKFIRRFPRGSANLSNSPFLVPTYKMKILRRFLSRARGRSPAIPAATTHEQATAHDSQAEAGRLRAEADRLRSERDKWRGLYEHLRGEIGTCVQAAFRAREEKLRSRWAELEGELEEALVGEEMRRRENVR